MEKVNGRRSPSQERLPTHMKVTMSMIKRMVTESSCGRVAINTKVITKMIRDTDMVTCIGLMGPFTKDTGTQGYKMVLVL